MVRSRAGLTCAVLLLFAVSLALAGTVRVPSATAGTVDTTATNISSSAVSTSPGGILTLTAYVTDTSSTPSPPGGVVSWADQGAGGSFSASTCTLSPSGSIQSMCSVTYTTSAPSGTTVTVLGSYAGDLSHYSSAGLATLPVFSPSTLAVSPGTLSGTTGEQINFTATVTDSASGTKSTPTGDVSWSDGGAGGSFTAALCSLSPSNGYSSACTVTYRTPAEVKSALPVTVTASYSGDALHGPSSSSSTLTVLPATISVTVNFQIVGSSHNAVPPAFTYVLNNVTKTVPLTSVPKTYEVDLNSAWFVPNQLGNSSAGEAWNLLGNSQGAAAYPFSSPNSTISMTFVYYHQYSVNLAYQVVGGTAGASIPPIMTYTSFGVTHHGAPPGQTWADVGTSYAYPALLPGSVGNVRWLAQNVSGTMEGPGDLSPTYYHQFSLSVSYAVKNGPPSQTAPLFFAQSMGTSFNVSLSTPKSNLWLDAGSQYSLTDPLAGSNSTLRWSAGPSATGPVTSSNIAVTYYPQNPIMASFTTTDGSTPSVVKAGVTTPVNGSLSGVSGNKSVTIPLSTKPQVVWLDSGSTFSIPSTLFASSGERWIATGAVTGKVALGTIALQKYYHEYLLTVSSPPSGGVSSGLPFTYTQLGALAQTTLSPQASTVWADAGTQFSVLDTAVGDRWYAPGAPGEVASSNMTVAFYHQYILNVSLKVEGSGQPAQIYISGVSGGKQVKELLSTESQSIWLDSDTRYYIPQTLLQLTNERWVASSALNGTIASPATVSQEYYHQVLLNVSSSGVPSGKAPIVSYVSFGTNTTALLTPNVSSLWGDVGTPLWVQGTINGTAGERWFSGFPSLTIQTPFQTSIQYFHQYLLTYSSSAVGQTMSVAPKITATAAGKTASLNISSKGGELWLDGGSTWRASPPTLASGQSGTRWGSSGPTEGTITAPTTANLSYYVQFLVTTAASPASGGTVTPGQWFNASSKVVLQAVPTKGWTLGGWNGLGTSSYSGTNSTVSISVLSPMNETALFEPGLTIISSSGGSVKYTTGTSFEAVAGGQSVQTYTAANGSVTLQAHAAFPYQFVRWSGAGTQTSSRLTLNLSAPTQIEAVFAPNYMDIIGIPVAVFATGLTTYVARHSILASGRHLIRDLKEALSG